MTAAEPGVVVTRSEWSWWGVLFWGGVAVLQAAIFYEAVLSLWANYKFVDSYYTHGPLVPFVSLFFVWRKWPELSETRPAPSRFGIGVVVGACLLVLLGDFLGFRIFGQFAMLLMLLGLLLSIYGWSHLLVLWFPLVFLLFMIPIPDSITQSLVLNIKLFATESAVRLAHLVSLPMIRDGSYVIFGNDRLLVGEVCGGLRSLIALLAMGAIMSYISQSRDWARCVLFVLAVPVALAANIVRIFFLCVVAYYWGSQTASGKVHDISGILIYGVAFILFFGVEHALRTLAPAKSDRGGENRT